METRRPNDQDQPAKEEEEPILIVRPLSSDMTLGGFLRQWGKEFKENLAAWEEKYPALMVVVYSSQILGFLTVLYGAAVGSAPETLIGFLVNYIGYLTYGRMGNTKP
jgi:hypothetical protein